MTDMISGGK